MDNGGFVKMPRGENRENRSTELSAQSRFPALFLSAVVMLTCGVIGFLTWSIYESYRFTKIEHNQTHRLIELRGTISHLDEVLTMSARMSAVTGDPAWEARYRRYEPVLDTAIKEAIKLAGPFGAADEAEKTDVANLVLVEMEYRSFDRVRQGRAKEALEILFSKEYETQKQIYADGMTRLMEQLKKETDLALMRERNMAARSTAAAAVVLPLLGLVWFFVLRKIDRWKEAMVEMNDLLVKGTRELTSLAETMDCQMIEKITTLRESEERFRQLAEHIRDVFWMANLDFTQILYVSPAYENIWGKSCAELYREPLSWMTSIHPEDIERVRMVIFSIRDSPAPFEMEYRIIRPGGGVRHILDRGFPIHDPSGKVYRFAGLAADVTRRREMESELRSTVDRLARQQRALVEIPMSIEMLGDDVMAALRRILEVDAKIIGVERVGVWRYTEDRSAIRCIGLYELGPDRHSSGVELPTAPYPNYFRALEEKDIIAADDANLDPRTSEFSGAYLMPLGITSMMDAPIQRGGVLEGILCHEHVGPPRRWSPDEQTFAMAMAGLICQLMEQSDRRRAERELRLAHVELEKRVEDRTAELSKANESLRLEIADRKRIEYELKQKAEELARSNSDLEQLGTVVSHDLKEPLRVIENYVSLLAKRSKGNLDPSSEKFIDIISDAAVRMRELIDDLLEYSRLGVRRKAFGSTDVSMVLARAVQNLQVALQESGARVTYDPMPTISADGVLLTQLFQNLIGNAIKFRGESAPEIHVRVERKDSEIVFSVRDNGIGIAPKYHERIFQIFQRLHPRTEYPGTGIGLALCKKIAERHGGRIWVESEPGRGSKFCVSIPDPASGGIC